MIYGRLSTPTKGRTNLHSINRELQLIHKSSFIPSFYIFIVHKEREGWESQRERRGKAAAGRLWPPGSHGDESFPSLACCPYLLLLPLSFIFFLYFLCLLCFSVISFNKHLASLVSWFEFIKFDFIHEFFFTVLMELFLHPLIDHLRFYALCSCWERLGAIIFIPSISNSWTILNFIEMIHVI